MANRKLEERIQALHNRLREVTELLDEAQVLAQSVVADALEDQSPVSFHQNLAAFGVFIGLETARHQTRNVLSSLNLFEAGRSDLT